MPTLHVVIPVFNEEATLESCLERVCAVKLPDAWSLRIHVIDDHSDEPHFQAAQAAIDGLKQQGAAISLTRHDRNRGKGAALQTGFDQIFDEDPPGDDVVVIQDADLEYDPSDFSALLEPIRAGRADAVIGTRWGPHRPLLRLKHRVHAAGNRFLTRLSNLVTGLRITDMECCYKMMKLSVLRTIRPRLTEQRFGIEPQIVAALAHHEISIAEVPVTYKPRRPSAGKKIGFKDGVRALQVIARERRR